LNAANDNDKGSSWSEEQPKKIEQEHHPKWFKPCPSCRSFRLSVFLCCVPLVQNVQKVIYGPASWLKNPSKHMIPYFGVKKRLHNPLEFSIKMYLTLRCVYWIYGVVKAVILFRK